MYEPIYATADDKMLRIDYTNHRGERSIRRVTPLAMVYGVTNWHRMQQWLLKAWDHDKRAERYFALSDCHSFTAARSETDTET